MEVSLLASITESKSGGSSIVFWDLNKQQIHQKLNAAHDGHQITDIQFMNKEPVLVSSSNDANSVKMWLFEKGLLVPRLLR